MGLFAISTPSCFCFALFLDFIKFFQRWSLEIACLNDQLWHELYAMMCWECPSNSRWWPHFLVAHLQLHPLLWQLSLSVPTFGFLLQLLLDCCNCCLHLFLSLFPCWLVLLPWWPHCPNFLPSLFWSFIWVCHLWIKVRLTRTRNEDRWPSHRVSNTKNIFIRSKCELLNLVVDWRLCPTWLLEWESSEGCVPHRCRRRSQVKAIYK